MTNLMKDKRAFDKANNDNNPPMDTVENSSDSGVSTPAEMERFQQEVTRERKKEMRQKGVEPSTLNAGDANPAAAPKPSTKK